MKCGYIKLYRKSLDSGIMQNHKLWVFWTWCLLKATHKPRKQMVGYQMVELKPGQFIFGRKAAAIELEISERSIRTCLQHLINLENLTIKATNKYSIVTVVNWDSYQLDENKNDQQTAIKRPASDQQATTNKNVKECKNVKKKENPLPPIPDFIDPELWEQYLLIRKKKKASDTPYAIKLLINKLTKYHTEGLDPNESLRDSIEGSWKSVYEPKNSKKGIDNDKYTNF